MRSEVKRQLVRRVRNIVVVVLTLLALGFVADTFSEPVWEGVRERHEAYSQNLSSSERLMQGAISGILGGLRGIVADFFFISANEFWAQKDTAKMEAALYSTTTVDPEQLYFFIHGAQILSRELPHFLIKEYREANPGEEVTPEIVLQLRAQAAERAFRFLDRAQKFHPAAHELVRERAMIHQMQLNNTERAAELFLKASKMEGAPYFYARLYAEMMRDLNRPRVAYAFYRDLYPTLPSEEEEPYAQKATVLERIRDLEAELEIPEDERYMPK